MVARHASIIMQTWQEPSEYPCGARTHGTFQYYFAPAWFRWDLKWTPGATCGNTLAAELGWNDRSPRDNIGKICLGHPICWQMWKACFVSLTRWDGNIDPFLSLSILSASWNDTNEQQINVIMVSCGEMITAIQSGKPIELLSNSMNKPMNLIPMSMKRTDALADLYAHLAELPFQFILCDLHAFFWF